MKQVRIGELKARLTMMLNARLKKALILVIQVVVALLIVTILSMFNVFHVRPVY